jgi:hypothetical protein
MSLKHDHGLSICIAVRMPFFNAECRHRRVMAPAFDRIVDLWVHCSSRSAADKQHAFATMPGNAVPGVGSTLLQSCQQVSTTALSSGSLISETNPATIINVPNNQPTHLPGHDATSAYTDHLTHGHVN